MMSATLPVSPSLGWFVNTQNLHFCPRCGHKGFVFDGIKKYNCTPCGFTFYFNPAAAVAAVILDGSLVLTAVRARDPGKGKLDFPGGFVDPGESADAGLVRELREELGAEPMSLKYFCSSFNVYRYADVDYTICDVFYRCEFEDLSMLRAADDVEAIRWVPVNQLRVRDFAFVSAKPVIDKLQVELSSCQ